MDNLAKFTVLILVVLFQSDIRNALAQFGLIAFFRDSSGQLKKDIVDQSLQACINMASNRIGALIVFEREVGLRNFIEKSTQIDAVLSEGLLLSIFHPRSPLHDGAVIVSNKGRLAAARCILPVSMNTRLSPVLGTRHRSGIGLTEETDSVVLIVSEERSEISLSYKGELIRESEDNIKEILFDLLVGKRVPEALEQEIEKREQEKEELKEKAALKEKEEKEKASQIVAEEASQTESDEISEKEPVEQTPTDSKEDAPLESKENNSTVAVSQKNSKAESDTTIESDQIETTEQKDVSQSIEPKDTQEKTETSETPKNKDVPPETRVTTDVESTV